MSSKKKKKNEQRASFVYWSKVFSSSCLKRACHKIANGEEEKKFCDICFFALKILVFA